ncbi:MAG: dCTP deaminase [Candidatus Wildermuthbacteria bacterium RIFCSPLOWO2_12_FULL_40_9]|uniref:dCTP deaminase n=2 Tax=Candidatus Wildermuthiibacteriota TaxID=1817923 RepID=A0A1G2RDU8_9BACT|nr:MAG: dCTP deaminase [Candidatus Wildermuthbacteria bacterium RIFCSPHIGHO2_12_FULL_40_12]OHA77216.1 MAG: dCTP deaminase [Candidatus Wildermuthbacteria bacterium RIFCSPLOWO2_12_FULL_40_9]
MILSDRDIKQYIQQGKIKIDPSPDFKTQLGPCSIDLHLGNVFKVFKVSSYPYLDPKRDIDFEEIMEEIKVPEGGPFILQPKSFVLTTTKENFSINNEIMARLDGRSSLARLGVIVHLTSARFDPGWHGKAVLEIGNLGIMPVILYAGITRICALTFEKLSNPSETPYLQQADHKYAEPDSPQASKINHEHKK